MLKTKLLFILFSSFIVQISFGQNQCFSIVDSLTGLPIPYCNISIDSDKGMVSNHLGEFCINMAEAQTEIVIYNIAYHEKQIKLNKKGSKTVLLSSKNYQLNMVNINWSDYKFYWKGNKTKPNGYYKNLWRFCQLGISIYPLKRGAGIIEEVVVPIKNISEKKVPFRLHIYIIDSAFKVGKELLPENVFGHLDKEKQGVVRLDVLKYQIEIPENGVFVAVEILSNNRPVEAQIGTGQKYSEKYNNQIAITKAKYRHRKMLKLSAWKPNSFYIEEYPFTNVKGIYGELPLIRVKVRKIRR